MAVSVDGLLELASQAEEGLEKEASAEDSQDELPEAQKLATLLDKVAEADEKKEEAQPLDKVAESVAIYRKLEEEGLV